MTAHDDRIGEIEEDIRVLRKQGSKAAIEAADELEVRVMRMRNPAPRIEQMSVERLADWMREITTELRIIGGVPLSDIDNDKFPERLKEDALQAMELAYAASLFRMRDTARMLGIPLATLELWQSSEAWANYAKKPDRRITQVVAIADLTMARMAHIMAIDSNDIEVLKLQARVGEFALSNGLKVPNAIPGAGKSGKPNSHRQLGPTESADEVPKKRAPAVVTLVPKTGKKE